MAEKWENGHFWAIFGPIFPFLSHFPPLFRVGPKSIFRPFFSHLGPEARFGVCTGQSGLSRSSGELDSLPSDSPNSSPIHRLVHAQAKQTVPPFVLALGSSPHVQVPLRGPPPTPCALGPPPPPAWAAPFRALQKEPRGVGGRGKERAGREGVWLEGRVLQLQWGMLGNGPNTVSESTVSKTKLSEFFGAH